MVNPRKHRHFVAGVRPRVTAAALTQSLERLTNHEDNALASAARAVLQCAYTSGPLDARSFGNVYLEILRQADALSPDLGVHEWRAVRDCGIDVYHALLRQFPEDLKARRARGIRRPRRAADRAGVKPAEA